MTEQFDGYTGKILCVDLTSDEISQIETSKYYPFLGGVGICAAIHFDMVGPEVTGHDPENVLTMITSPTIGTPAPSGQKTCMGGVSPHMWPKNTFMKSVFGGMWGPELKYAGWDGVVVKGKAETPVYILIEDDKVEIRDASDLWGLDTANTQETLWHRFNDKYRVLLIGPAGENLVGDSVVMTDDSNTAGKGGFGAVFGSKNLKAVVVRGTGHVSIRDPKKLLDLAYEAQRYVTRKEGEAEPSHSYRGSLFGPISVEGSDIWNEAQEEGSPVDIGYSGCMMCNISCGMTIKFNDGSQDPIGHVMCVEVTNEAEEGGYGRTTMKRLKEQDRLGYSEFAMHMDIWPLFTYGFITPQDLEIDAEIGTPEFSRQLLHKICYREGLGDVLAEGGAHFLNEFVGTDEAKHLYQMQAVNSGSSRLPYNYGANFYGPVGWVGSCVARGRDNDLCWGMQNAYTDPRVMVQGTDEYYAMQFGLAEQLWGTSEGIEAQVQFQFSDHTAEIAYTAHNLKTWYDAVGCCSNYTTHVSMYTDDHMGSWEVRRDMVQAVTGQDLSSMEKEKEFCDRIWMIERCILAAQGTTKEDDWMYDCIFEDESYAMYGLTKEKLRTAIDQYYELRGMDVETGLPRRSTLANLGLEYAADKLENEYGIALPA